MKNSTSTGYSSARVSPAGDPENCLPFRLFHFDLGNIEPGGAVEFGEFLPPT